MIANINETLTPVKTSTDNNKRGLQVYTMSQLMSITGRTESGEMVTGNYDQSIFYLTIPERINIFRLCAPVFSVVSARMNIISGMEFEITADKKHEDKIAAQLKNYRDFIKEIGENPDPRYIVAKAKIQADIMRTLPDCLPDMSNFDKSLLRWKRRIQDANVDQADWIKEWILQPNINDRYDEFIKKIVFDLMIHGAMSIYKEVLNNKVENIYLLPGGTVIPLKNKFISGANAYVQTSSAVTEPMIYFSDELAYANYIPTTARAYGMIPLEALINKVAETLLFDKLMANQADGTKPPEKMVIIANNSPFGDLNKEFELPVDPEEQSRIESKINEPMKNAIMTFSGNDVHVVDLSRENTMSIQMQRQKDIREEVGMVFQATSMEMNLTGSDDVSGRSTAEAQRDIYNSRGILPITNIIEMVYNRDIIPFRFGNGFTMEYSKGKSEIEDLEALQRKVNLGLYSTNELRVDELNESPFEGEEFDKPQGAQTSPDGSPFNPFNFQEQ